MKWFRSLLQHNRTAIVVIAGAAVAAVADSIKAGAVDWNMVGAAALTALAGLAKSAIHDSPGTDNPQ